MIRDTSLAAYGEVKLTLGARQQRVLQALKDSPVPLANREIAMNLQMEINSITPRVKELRNLDLVEEKCRKIIMGRECMAWGLKIKTDEGQGVLF